MKSLIASICILALVSLAIGVAVQAAGEVGVSATVTPRLLSVSVSPTSVAYGTVDIPSTDNVPTGDTIIAATNDGNDTAKFNIKGADATGDTITWTIVDGAPGGAATYNYNHKFLDCGGDSGCSSPAAANNMTTSYEELEASVATTNSEYFKLRLSTPTETGGDFSEHSTTVTVQAVAP